MAIWLIAYIAALAAMAGLDFAWLSLTAGPLYRGMLGAIMAEKPNWTAAISFYLLYGMGIVLLAVRPVVPGGDWRAAVLWGAVLGLVAYGTYDLTNLATLKIWSLKISLIDMAWGACLTALSAGVSAWAALTLQK